MPRREPVSLPSPAAARRCPSPAWLRALDQAALAGETSPRSSSVCCCTFQDISILTVSKCLSIVVSGLFLFSSCWAPSLLA